MIINGPNLNMLKYRDQEIYGKYDFDWLENKINNHYNKIDSIKIEMEFSNFEGEIIEMIHKATKNNYAAIIINPAAYSHYSYAIRDALEIFNGIKIEVHLSDVDKRENFRQQLVNADVIDFMISGKYMLGYIEALEYVISQY